MFLAVLLVFGATGSTAATLNIDVNGKLVGASGVNVGGTLYSVQFMEGTCISLFSGCDSTTDFTFQTQADAVGAVQSLLDQVFIDGLFGNFDSVPARTFGCVDLRVCSALTPFGVGATVAGAVNGHPDYEVDGVEFVTISPASSTTFTSASVFAVWSEAPAIPEPTTTMLIFVVGLTVAARAVRKSRRALAARTV
jgi:hypothetical protein